MVGKDIERVVLACIPCHMVIEVWPKEKMEEFLEKIIANREVQP